ncbi:hypothetical protein L9G74_18930 [Shewanella sp. C32]|uniref:Uncharacterized protein n=1 Tax=Shewanella electrica TaxID=515560 RepID=A0ABT2FTG5_9GAMM|nr:hypothetical protein [Shewanella electrica]MCH1926896.1 hypothetical protein [Shewanella electrica]MCS4558514.1 hypothetical protein [Shewanella electrica]
MEAKDLDLTREDSAFVNEQAAKVVMQLQEWFNARRDHLTGIAQHDAEVIKIGDKEIDDPEFISGFRFGLKFAMHFFGEMPISIDDGD